jgi:hypothetical protein
MNVDIFLDEDFPFFGLTVKDFPFFGLEMEDSESHALKLFKTVL